MQEDQKKKYENELTLAFWFACHQEDINTAQLLINEEFFIKILVATALFSYEDYGESISFEPEPNLKIDNAKESEDQKDDEDLNFDLSSSRV